MAGILGPYDPPSPCVTTFCKRIPKEEYEKQASETTQQAIADLIKYLEYNPTAYYNILRKRKREDQENEGLFSWLKVKMLSAIHGDDYCEQIDQNEAKDKLVALKDEMIEAYNYAEGARGSGIRFSERLLQKRLMNQNKFVKGISHSRNDSALAQDKTISKQLEKELLSSSIDENNTSIGKPATFTVPPAPPPPPLNPISGASSNIGSICDNSQLQNFRRPETKKQLTQVKTRSKVAIEEKENVYKDPSTDLNNLFKSICDPNIRKALKPVNIGLTDETPMQVRKRINRAKEDTANAFPAFNQQLIDKFHNARSPQSPQFLSDVSSPGSFIISP